LPSACQGPSSARTWGQPDFRANGRIFATLTADGSRGMVKLTPPQQKEFADANRGIFEPASGAWGRQGCTMVALTVVDEETMGEAMTLAWKNTIAARAKKPGRSASRGTRRR